MTTHPTDGYTDKLQQVREALVKIRDESREAHTNEMAIQQFSLEAIIILDELQAQHEAAPDVVEIVRMAMHQADYPHKGALSIRDIEILAKAAINAMGDASTRKDEDEIGETCTTTHADQDTTSPASDAPTGYLDALPILTSDYKQTIKILEEEIQHLHHTMKLLVGDKSGEIRVVNDAGAVKTMLAACEGLEDLEDCMRAAYHALDADEYLAKHKPVSVSLMDCAMALQGNERIRLGSDLRVIAKAVLDTAGVKYVD